MDSIKIRSLVVGKKSFRLLFALVLVFLSPLSCGSSSVHAPAKKTSDSSSGLLNVLDNTRWNWVEARCVDRPLDLISRGFEQELRVRVQNQKLILVFDNEFMSEGCEQTIVMFATPAREKNLWQIEEEARVALPVDDACFGKPEQLRPGVIKLSGDTLEIWIYQSNLCDGFDVQFAYRSVGNKQLSDEQLIRRYAAYFNQRDSVAIAGLFADTGSVIEPFAATAHGNPKRNEGRSEVEKYYRALFESASWSALKLISIEQEKAEGQLIASWEYMDSRLEKPFSGRNLFIMAGGEILRRNFRLRLTSPKPNLKMRNPPQANKS
jgi:hypothetical protein